MPSVRAMTRTSTGRAALSRLIVSPEAPMTPSAHHADTRLAALVIRTGPSRRKTAKEITAPTTPASRESTTCSRRIASKICTRRGGTPVMETRHGAAGDLPADAPGSLPPVVSAGLPAVSSAALPAVFPARTASMARTRRRSSATGRVSSASCATTRLVVPSEPRSLPATRGWVAAALRASSKRSGEASAAGRSGSPRRVRMSSRLTAPVTTPSSSSRASTRRRRPRTPAGEKGSAPSSSRRHAPSSEPNCSKTSSIWAKAASSERMIEVG